MIKNRREYAFTRTAIKRFEEELSALKQRSPLPEGLHPLLAKAEVESVESMITDLKAQLSEYDDLRAGKFNYEPLRNITAIPQNLIRARIAQGLTQKQLAQRLGLKEQQIQQYEATDYASASLSRILDMAAVLDPRYTQNPPS